MDYLAVSNIDECEELRRSGITLPILMLGFTPADQVCTHEKTEITRTRKLLMHRKEIDRLIGKVDRSGYALVPLDLHFKKNRVKLELALGRGKREFEKRSDESKREWKRDQSRLMKNDMRSGKPRQNYKDA